MGMVLLLRKVSDNQLDEFHKNPAHIAWFLTGVENEPSFMQKMSALFGKRPDPKEWEEPSENEQTDLDKAWQGIHFLFTGTPFGGSGPASYLFTGKTIGKVDVGYGPAMSLSSKDVLDFNAYLQSVDEDSLKQQYNPQKMVELDIYPNIWEKDEDALEYLLEYFRVLKIFVMNAAKENQALIIYLA